MNPAPKNLDRPSHNFSPMIVTNAPRELKIHGARPVG